ncbi:MAG: DEAD/DEAH box helicase [Kiritimatiellia bacterium]|jgi:type III restriction enzyme
MIVLKDYQHRVLDSLKAFFTLCVKTGDPGHAFHEVAKANGHGDAVYVPVNAAGLKPQTPYVCLRVPTGGGKTLLACHAAGLAMRGLLQADRAVVLWLVPSNTILDQTANALRDVRHPYRQALEMACGSVEVATIEEALNLSRAAVDGQTVVIVSTIQAFRVEDPTGRKVYSQNGAFGEHLLNMPPGRVGDMLEGPDGKPVPSLVNALRLRRPIVIVDEAHNARTNLSFAALGDVMPSCILEFTATPARRNNPSNVLHRVSAAELKAADMVKLPLRVVTRHPSQKEQLLSDSVILRNDLEKLAVAEGQATGEYIRPILLVQAEKVDDCKPLRERLVAEYGIPSKEIIISVGAFDELKDVEDIQSPACPVRYVITVQKLREGWDCPFAYVLCSLKETRSATAIEQIVGRILRLPNARPKRDPDLNCSYALSVSGTLPEVLNDFREALESNGFTKAESERVVIPESQAFFPLGVQPKTFFLSPEEIDADVAKAQEAALCGKVQISRETGRVTVLVPLDETETEQVASCLRTPEARERFAEFSREVASIEKESGGTGGPRALSPFQMRLDFSVPLLCIQEGDLFHEFERTHLLEHPWRLGSKDATLHPSYDPLNRPAPEAGRLDVGDKGQVTSDIVRKGEPEHDFIKELRQQTLALDRMTDMDWTIEELIVWLDRRIDHEDIPHAESAVFLRKAITGLMTRYAMPHVGALVFDRFRLCQMIEEKIDQHREEERKQAYQQLLELDSPLAVRDEHAINFKDVAYEPSWAFEGAFAFQKHYFGAKPGELKEKTANGDLAEEFRCAQFLDAQVPEIKFWVRNLPRRPTSFRLQTHADWFYPDFVCKLEDGRILVVEYKGAHLYDAPDAQEKRDIGNLWAARSQGRCLFVMPSKARFHEIVDNIRFR